MKTIARVALKPGMELGENILYNNGEIMIPAHTVVDEAVLSRLKRHNIMVVSIMEAIDYATTHFEKVRLSEGFKCFEATYLALFPQYKHMMTDLAVNGTAVDTDLLLSFYHSLTDPVVLPNDILDYLYNMIPGEDELTHTHCLNSALIAGVFGEWWHLNEEEKNTLILCAYFYDIGKLKLPDSLLWKPGKLTDVEYARIKTHPILGFQLAGTQTNLSPAILKSILMHHEHCDGSGYPSHLKMQQIDSFARRIAIIDAYEAMTSPRTYRQSLMPLEVLERLAESGLLKYDYEMLRPVMTHIANSQIGLSVRLNDDSIWEIFMINENKLHRPVLKRVNADGNMEILDLNIRSELNILAIY